MPTEYEVIAAIAHRFPDAKYDRHGKWPTNFETKSANDFGDWIAARSDVLTRYKVYTGMGRVMVYYDVVSPEDNPNSAAHEWMAAFDKADGDDEERYLLSLKMRMGEPLP